MQKFLGILAVSTLLSAPASASVVLHGPETLSTTPFTFAREAADQFSFSYPSSGFFADTFVSTTGTAEVTSFGGFLGIPVAPTTDSRTAVATMTCSSDWTSSVHIQGSPPRRTSPILRSIASSAFATPSGTTPSMDLRASPEATLKLMVLRRFPTSTSTQTPRLWRRQSSRAMMGLGFVGTALLAKRRRSLRLA
jgi:hypothetical protein